METSKQWQLARDAAERYEEQLIAYETDQGVRVPFCTLLAKGMK